MKETPEEYSKRVSNMSDVEWQKEWEQFMKNEKEKGLVDLHITMKQNKSLGEIK